MAHPTTSAAAQPDSFDPIPYLRGLTHLITQQRIAYVLDRTRRRQPRRRRLLASSVVWLVIARSLVASHPIPKL